MLSSPYYADNYAGTIDTSLMIARSLSYYAKCAVLLSRSILTHGHLTYVIAYQDAY